MPKMNQEGEKLDKKMLETGQAICMNKNLGT
jgi:hypothetical protein